MNAESKLNLGRHLLTAPLQRHTDATSAEMHFCQPGPWAGRYMDLQCRNPGTNSNAEVTFYTVSGLYALFVVFYVILTEEWFVIAFVPVIYSEKATDSSSSLQ